MAGMFGVDLSALPSDIMTRIRSVPQGIAGDISHLFTPSGSTAAAPAAQTAGGITSPAGPASAADAQPQSLEGIIGAPPIPDATIAPIVQIAPAQAPSLISGGGIAPRPVGQINFQPQAGPGAASSGHMATLGQFHSLMQQISPGWGS